MQQHLLGSSKQPNPPRWPASVRVFSPSDTDIEKVVHEAYRCNGRGETYSNGEFSEQRFAFLFKPGRYMNLDLPVGYYTHVLGLGSTPDAVVFAGGKGVYSEASVPGMTLTTFWRSAENFKSGADHDWRGRGVRGMQWGTSQASPLRRVKVARNLILHDEGRGG